MSGACIYPGPEHGLMSEEHYLPAALGRFRGYEPLNGRVCDRCNREIGRRIEEHFLRAVPVVFFRLLLGVRGRDGHPTPFYREAAGASPLDIRGRVPGRSYDLFWEMVPGTAGVFPARQIVFEHPTQGTVPVLIRDYMRDRPEMLRDYLREQGLDGARPVSAFAKDDERPWVSALFEALGGSPPAWEAPSFPAEPVTLEAFGTFDREIYERAIAKIAFHYALKIFPDLTGLEPEFAGIRAFIWDGGDAGAFVREREDQFLTNFRGGARPVHWMHILVAERTPEWIVAHVQLFAGPDWPPPQPYRVQIGANPARLIRPPELRGHLFVIQEPTAPSGPAGVMEERQFFRA